jgi:hypothetical protein
LLDTRDVSGFRNGQYLVWDVSGNVQLRLVNTGSGNAVASGLFFGAAGAAPAPAPAPSPTTSARFLQVDTTTAGSWKGVYGSAGSFIYNDTPMLPAWANVTVSQGWGYIWSASTTDTRAPQRAAGTDRLATCWWTTGTAIFDVKITDGAVHRLAFYMLDWDGLNRTQRIEVHDAATGALLDSRDVTNFRNGQYLVWEVSGNVQIWVVNRGSGNAVASGLFIS